MALSSVITFRRSLHDQVWLHEALGFASAKDVIVLTEDAVQDVMSPINLASFLAKCEGLGVTVMALDEDMRERGVTRNPLNIPVVDRTHLVQLFQSSAKHVAW